MGTSEGEVDHTRVSAQHVVLDGLGEVVAALALLLIDRTNISLVVGHAQCDARKRLPTIGAAPSARTDATQACLDPSWPAPLPIPEGPTTPQGAAPLTTFPRFG